MNDPFEKKVRAAASAGCWIDLLIEDELSEKKSKIS